MSLNFDKQIMKVDLEHFVTGKSKTQRDNPAGKFEQNRITHSRREVSPQPLKPNANDFNGLPQVRSPIKAKMTQLSPKKIQETPNDLVKTRSKSCIPTNQSEEKESTTLNQTIYRKLFEKFNERQEQPLFLGSPKRAIEINEVYRLRKELMEKYDKHVQSKRRLSMRNQSLKQQLKSKSERTQTKIGVTDDQSILLEEKRLTKNDIQDFLRRVEQSQERKERELTRAASQLSIEEPKWKMLPKSRIIVSRSLDKKSFQQAMHTARKSKPLFEPLNFSPRRSNHSISKTEFKRDTPGSEPRSKGGLTRLERDEIIKFEIDKMQESIRNVIQRASQKQSLLAGRIKKRINKIFDKKFECIKTHDNQIDMGALLKLVGAISFCTIEKRVVPNHQNLKRNLLTLILAILDLSPLQIDEKPQQIQFIVNKMLTEDKLKSAANLVSFTEPVVFTLAQERRLQQHFAEFAEELKKKKLQNVKHQTALGSPRQNRKISELKEGNQQQQMVSLQSSNLLSIDTLKMKRDNFLNQLIEYKDKTNDSEQAFSQKRLTQGDLRGAIKSQLESHRGLEKFDGSNTGRKSVNATQKSRNTPAVYSQATEQQLKTVRNKSRVSLAQMTQQTKKPPAFKHTPAQSPRGIKAQKQYDPAMAIAAQNLLDRYVVQSGRTSKASTNTTKRQPLTTKKKAPTTTAVINLLENRKPLFIETKDIKQNQKCIQDQEGPQLPDSTENVITQEQPLVLSIDINPSKSSMNPSLQQSPQKPESAAESAIQEQQLVQVEDEKHIEQLADNNSDHMIDQQSRPSETVEQRRDTEPLVDQQSRPSEKFFQPAVEQHSESIDRLALKTELPPQQTSIDSIVSQNQGQQMEEQGAKDVEITKTDSQKIGDNEILASVVSNDQEVEREPIDQQQIQQTRFSAISNQSQSKFMSDSIRNSEQQQEIDIIEKEFAMGPLEASPFNLQQDQRDYDLKLTITEIGIVDPSKDALNNQARPNYMTFSQPYVEQECEEANAKEHIESQKLVLSALNLTQEVAANQDLEFKLDLEVAESEQLIENQQRLSLKSNSASIPQSETAFEKFKNQRKNQSPVKEDLKEKPNKLSSPDRNAQQKVPPARYSPKHASPKKIESRSVQKSDNNDVQTDIIEFQVSKTQSNRQENDKTQEEYTHRVDERSQLVETLGFVAEPSVTHTEVEQKEKVSFKEDLHQEKQIDQIESPTQQNLILDQKQPISEEVKQSQDEEVQSLPTVEPIQDENRNKTLVEETVILLPTSHPTIEQIVYTAEIQNEVNSILSSSSSESFPLPDAMSEPETVSQPEKEIKQKPKETIQGQLQAIKQGFVQFMQKREDAAAQPTQQTKQQSPFPQLSNQVNSMMKKVQENISKPTNPPQEDEEIKEQKAPLTQTMGQVNGFLKIVQENLKQTSVSEILKNPDSIKETLKPIQEHVSQSLPGSLLQTITDKIPQNLIKTIQEQLPQSVQAEAITATILKQKAVQDASDSGVVEHRDQEQTKDIVLDDLPSLQQQPIASEKSQHKAQTVPDEKCVDKMAAVLDRLDAEYEEELKNKPKKLTKKSSKKSKEPKTSAQKRSSSGKKNPLDLITSTKRASRDSPVTSTKKSLKRLKTEELPKKKKAESTPKVIEPVEQQNKAKNASTYQTFPNRIVDAPEIMFFFASWFQIKGKRNKK